MPLARGVVASDGVVRPFWPRILTKAEAAGDAMRYVNAKGRIAWKATPRLRGYLEDLQADARADDEHEAI